MPTFTKIPVDVERQVFDYVGTGAPTTLLANAPAGATYRQIDGGAGGMLWQKTTAGWEALQASSWNQALADTLYARLAASNTMTNAIPFIFNNATSNWLQWANTGVAPPSTASRSLGTKLILYPAFSAGSQTDYAVGIESSTIWFGLPLATSSFQFRWYGAGTQIMQLLGTGALSFPQAATILDSIVFIGGPTGGMQIAFGDSTVRSRVGTIYSSGNVFMAYNAYQTTQATDSWTQGNASFPSGMLEIGIDGRLKFWGAVAGKTTAARATFWGAVPLFLITETGNTYVSSLLSLMRAGNDKGYFWIAANVNEGITGSTVDDLMIRVVTASKRILFSLDNGATAGYNFAQTGLVINQGYCSVATTFRAEGNFGSGMTGLYDPSKYRMVYAIGDPYKMTAAGTTVAGFYGIPYFYDDTTGVGINITSWAMGHGFGLVDNGNFRAIIAYAGIWTAGWLKCDNINTQGLTLFGDWFMDDRTNTPRRIAKIIVSSSAPTTETAPDGTIWIRT